MTTAYSSLMGLALPVQGELSGTWGDTVNNGITNYLDVALAGTQTISGSQTAVTLSLTNGNASATNIAQAGSGATGSAQYAIINCTGNPASLLTITVPASSRQYVVINATSTSQSVKVVGVGPTTGVTIVSGEKAHIVWNGSDFVKIASTAAGAAAGSNTQVQYNSSGSLAGSANLTFDGSSMVLDTSTSSAALRVTQRGSGDALLVEDSANPDSTPIVIDSTGGLIVGYTGRVGAGQSTNIQSLATGGNAGVSAFRFSNDAIPPRLQVGKSRSTTIGSYTIVQDGDQLGGVYFYGDDGTDLVSQGASILAEVDGTPGLNDMPGRLVFSTTADGASNSTERVRIDSSGQTKFSYSVVVDTADNTNAALRVTQRGTGDALLVEDSTNPDSTPFVIDASGRIIQGYTTAILTADDYNGVTRTGWGYQGNGTATAGALFTSWNASAAVGAGISLSRSKSATIGTQGIVASGDSLGGIGFNGDDGTSFISAASITSAVDGTPGTNDMPGRLVFSTTADGASTPTERMRLDSSGNLGIGLTPVANNGILQLNSYASVQAMMEKATVSATAATGTINFDAATQPVLYYTTNASGNWTINIRGSASLSLNSMMATGQSLTLAFLATNGATAYYQSALTIDGSSVTPKWQGGTAPTAGNASSIDAYVLTVIKTGSATFTVLASQTKFA